MFREDSVKEVVLELKLHFTQRTSIIQEMHEGSVAEAKSMAGVVGSGWLEGRRRDKKG